MSSPTSPHHPASSPSFSSPSTSSPLPVWHFPFGPSSRYHNSERPKLSRHSRTKTTHGRAPVLSTEARARRRAQNSSYPTPPLSESTEYCRSPLSRFSSYSNPATMPPMVKNAAPLTPAKTPRRNSSLQDSPFSDYFSDDARSSTNAIAPSNDTKALLVRMNKLQSQLMRDQSDNGAEAIRIVGQKLTEIEQRLGSLHCQMQSPDELDDSGVFTTEDKSAASLLQAKEQDKDAVSMQHLRQPSFQSVNSSVGSSAIFSEDGATLKQYKAERDWYLLRMQELLENLNDVQAELRQRQAEFKELHELHRSSIEEKEEQLERLRSENEGLRQDLGFEYSELLFLKLQMKALEVDIDDLRDEDIIIDTAVERRKREKKNRILSEMDRWRTDSDWQDVEARFKRRRCKYGIPTSPICQSSIGAFTAPEDIDWSLETVRGGEGRGRITSLTIKRTNSSPVVPKFEDDASDASQQQPVTLGGTTALLDHGAQSRNTRDRLDEANVTPAQQNISSEYAEAWTQTDQTLTLNHLPLEEGSLPAEQQQRNQQQYLSEDEDFSDSNPEEEDEEDEEEDCAITSTSSASSESEDAYQDVEKSDEDTLVHDPTITVSVPHKSAWQELWSSLSSLTGLPDEDDEDEE